MADADDANALRAQRLNNRIQNREAPNAPAAAGNQNEPANNPNDNQDQPPIVQGAPNVVVSPGMREMFGRLGVDGQGIDFLTNPGLGGLNTIEAFANLPYQEGVDNVFKTLERGGGYMPVEQGAPGNAAPVSNRGVRLTPVAKSNLPNLVFFTHYAQRCQRAWHPRQVTPTFLQHFHTVERSSCDQ